MSILTFFSIYFNSIFVLFFLVILFLLYPNLQSRKYNRGQDLFLLISFLAFYALLFGLRGEDIGSDTLRYLEDYELSVKGYSYDVMLNRSKTGRDPFFVLFTLYLGAFGSATFYLFTISFFYILGVFLVIKKVTKQYFSILLFSFLCFGFVYSLGINIIRNGLSIVYSILGLLILLSDDLKRKDYIYGMSFLLIGILFHSSSIIFVGVFLIIKLLRINVLWYYVLFVFTTVLALLKFSLKNLPIIGGYISNSERMLVYVSGEASQPPSGVTSYILMFQYLMFFYSAYFLKKIDDSSFLNFVKCYLLISSFYFLCLDISFSDRFGILGWVFMPIILAYPVIYKKEVNLSNAIFFVITSLSYLLLTYYRVDFEQ